MTDHRKMLVAAMIDAYEEAMDEGAGGYMDAALGALTGPVFARLIRNSQAYWEDERIRCTDQALAGYLYFALTGERPDFNVIRAALGARATTPPE